MKGNVLKFMWKSTDFSVSTKISNPYFQEEGVGLGFEQYDSCGFKVCQESENIGYWREGGQLVKSYTVKLVAELLVIVTEARNSLYITKH